MPKNNNYGLKVGGGGRGRQKNIGCKGGNTKRILSSFAVTASVIVGSLTMASKTSPKKSIRASQTYCNSFNLSNVGVEF